MGLQVAASSNQPAHFDPGFLMMMACSSLEESLRCMERLQTYWTDEARLRLQPLADGMRLRHEQPGVTGEYARLTEEAALAKVTRGLRALAGADAHPRIVRFRHMRPADTREHAALFCCEVVFGAGHSELELSADGDTS